MVPALGRGPVDYIRGTLLSATEKDALDIWYLRNASLGFDLRIIGMTLVDLVKNDWRGEGARAQAMKLHCQEPDSSEVQTSGMYVGMLRIGGPLLFGGGCGNGLASQVLVNCLRTEF
jgi:hypothetical protein